MSASGVTVSYTQRAGDKRWIRRGEAVLVCNALVTGSPANREFVNSISGIVTYVQYPED